MTESVRVLIHDLRSRGPAGPERAVAVADRILARAQDYDVLCLQEILDERTRATLLDRLSPAYPHQLDGLDCGVLPELSPAPADAGRLVLSRFPAGPGSTTRVIQHRVTAWELLDDPAAPAFGTGDHRPERLDLDVDRPHCSVLTAEPVAVTAAAPDATLAGRLVGGQMHWYRVAEPGGYRIELVEGGPRVRLDAYTADELSVPVKPFTTLDTPAGPTRYALPTGPFFLRVARADRSGDSAYRLVVHRCTGAGPAEAIPLLRDVPQAVDPGPDPVWFTAPLDTAADGSLTVTSVVTVLDPVTRGYGLTVLARAPGGDLEPVSGAGPDALVATAFRYDRPRTGYVVVRREDPAATGCTVALSSDVSYLYGFPARPGSRAKEPARLVRGDGSDDGPAPVAVVTAGPGGPELGPADVDGLRYTGTVRFEIGDPGDRVSVEVPQFADLTDAQVVSGDPTTKLARFPGRWELTVTVSSQPPADLA